MEDISGRIHYILKHYNITAGEFAAKLGIQKSSVSHLLSGRNKPSFQFLTKLNKVFPEINLNWFISGEGDIYKNSITDTGYDRLVENKKLSKEDGKEMHQPEKQERESSDEALNSLQVENVILVYRDDTFKILKKI